MNENEAYEMVIKSIESMDMSSARIDGGRFPMPSHADSFTPPDYALICRKGSQAVKAILQSD